MSERTEKRKRKTDEGKTREQTDQGKTREQRVQERTEVERCSAQYLGSKELSVATKQQPIVNLVVNVSVNHTYRHSFFMKNNTQISYIIKTQPLLNKSLHDNTIYLRQNSAYVSRVHQRVDVGRRGKACRQQADQAGNAVHRTGC